MWGTCGTRWEVMRSRRRKNKPGSGASPQTVVSGESRCTTLRLSSSVALAHRRAVGNGESSASSLGETGGETPFDRK